MDQYTHNPNLTIKTIEFVSLDNLSNILENSDLLCLLQDVDSLVAQYQSPAKVSDAAVFSLPILSTKTEAMLELSLSYQNIYFVEDYIDLKSAIIEAINNSPTNRLSQLPSAFSLLSNPLDRNYFQRFQNNLNKDHYSIEYI